MINIIILVFIVCHLVKFFLLFICTSVGDYHKERWILASFQVGYLTKKLTNIISCDTWTNNLPIDSHSNDYFGLWKLVAWTKIFKKLVLDGVKVFTWVQILGKGSMCLNSQSLVFKLFHEIYV
jgi:hypothetical protein